MQQFTHNYAVAKEALVGMPGIERFVESIHERLAIDIGRALMAKGLVTFDYYEDPWSFVRTYTAKFYHATDSRELIQLIETLEKRCDKAHAVIAEKDAKIADLNSQLFALKQERIEVRNAASKIINLAGTISDKSKV